jgi:hypothetical protein
MIGGLILAALILLIPPAVTTYVVSLVIPKKNKLRRIQLLCMVFLVVMAISMSFLFVFFGKEI